MSKDFNKRMTRGKSMARLLSVQALYSCSVLDDTDQAGWNMDTLSGDLLEFASDYVDNNDDVVQNIDKKFLKKSVEYVLQNIEDLDSVITKYLEKDWTIEHLGDLLASILRVAIYELQIDVKTPGSVIVSEYVSVADEFFDKDEIGFVNAILDKMSKDLRG